MPAYTQIVREMSESKFQEVFAVSIRKARETYLGRHNIKAPKSVKKSLRAGAKNEARVQALYALLKTVDDEQMVEEILRTWLLSRRDILGAALDYLEIPHDNGLTESDDVDRLTTLSLDELKPLVTALAETASQDDISIYLRFMGAQNVSDALSALD